MTRGSVDKPDRTPYVVFTFVSALLLTQIAFEALLEHYGDDANDKRGGLLLLVGLEYLLLAGAVIGGVVAVVRAPRSGKAWTSLAIASVIAGSLMWLMFFPSYVQPN
jgi:hypothetical protein